MGDLRESFDRSVAAATLTPADDAAVEAGRKLADRIDAAGEGAEATKAMYLMPHLVAVLRELHLTPASREKLPKQEATPVDLVDEIKAARQKKRSA